MGRLVMYTVLGALAFFVLSATFVVKHGNGSTQTAAVTVHDLQVQPSAFKGKVVHLVGTLGYSQEARQYQLVDDMHQAVVVRGGDAEVLRGLEGKAVNISGRFDFDSATGIYIKADQIKEGN